MVDYQGNANTKKTSNPDVPEKKLEKVVTGDVTVKPAGIGVKFKRIFLGGDVNSAAQYVVESVLLPALRNLVVDTISKGADRLIYGDSGRRRSTTPGYAPRVQYNNPIYRQEPRASLPDRPAWQQSGKPFENVIVGSKEDAENVIEQLITVVDTYEVVSVADLYELLGLPSSYVDNKWGWTKLSTIQSRQVRDGWEISFPPLEEIS